MADASYQRDPRAAPPGSLARAFTPAAVLQDGPHDNLLYHDGAQHQRVRGLVPRAFKLKSILATIRFVGFCELRLSLA